MKSMFATIETDFVSLTASATSDDSDALLHSLAMHQVNPQIALPRKLSVDAALGLVVELKSKARIQNFSFTLRLDNSCKPGSPESGQGLDAQNWGHCGGTLMIGTEDGELLRDRHSWYEPDLTSYYPIVYLPDGFGLSIHRIPPHAELSFHFVVAHCHRDLGDDATWFAVDVPHATMIDSPIVSRILFQCPS
ncbi:hypothetical protein [Rubripirellula obstinata]|nr:hypothetical protein [Rubripirellula obstinata]